MSDDELMRLLATDAVFVGSLGIRGGMSMDEILARARAVVGPVPEPEPLPEPEPEPEPVPEPEPLPVNDGARDAAAWDQAQEMVSKGWTLPELPPELVREAPTGDG
jgi:hypothetical protein